MPASTRPSRRRPGNEFAAACEAIKAKTKASCVTFGNKDGTDFINVVAIIAKGLWSPEIRAKFMAHDLAWTSDEMRAVFAKIKEMIDKGWIEKGVNSYSPYTDAVNIFAGARTGNSARSHLRRAQFLEEHGRHDR